MFIDYVWDITWGILPELFDASLGNTLVWYSVTISFCSGRKSKKEDQTRKKEHCKESEQTSFR